MRRIHRQPLIGFVLAGIILLTSSVRGDEAPRWGHAQVREVDYQGQKVVYDVAARSQQEFERVLDRASYLNNIYGADPFATSIVLVLHGDEIPFFALENREKYQDLMVRAYSLTVGDTIEFRMCRVAARDHGYEPQEIHGFITIVPMADAEIVRLQQEEGYVYMQ